MRAEIKLAHESAQGRSYLTWSPVEATIRLLPAGPEPVTVRLCTGSGDAGGQLEFSHRREQRRSRSLAVVLPPDGSPVAFWVAGVRGRPSSADLDAVIQVEAGEATLARKAVMVRVRKDADTLTVGERDRFTTALGKLNQRGFPPVHRGGLLDLERELQLIDASVTVPYWRFDRAAPTVFHPDFLGRTGPAGNLILSPANLLRQWQTGAGSGCTRDPVFDTVADSPRLPEPAMGGAQADFESMVLSAHGGAHLSIAGWIRTPATAGRDPLSLLLHCNVERLRAMWRWLHDRGTGAETDVAYDDVPHRPVTTMRELRRVIDAARPAGPPPGVEAPSLAALIVIVADRGDDTGVRVEALRLLGVATFEAARFAPHRPAYLAALRALITDPAAGLRETAVTILAQQHDPVAQAALADGLTGAGPPPIAFHRAIPLLAEDIRLDNLPRLRDLYAAGTPGEREQAVRFMGSYPAARTTLEAVLADRRESPGVRQQAGAALRRLVPASFDTIARQLATDPTDDPDVRVCCLTALHHLGGAPPDDAFRHRLQATAADESEPEVAALARALLSPPTPV